MVVLKKRARVPIDPSAAINLLQDERPVTANFFREYLINAGKIINTKFSFRIFLILKYYKF